MREHHFRVEHPRQVTTSMSLSRCLPNEDMFVGIDGEALRGLPRKTREDDQEHRQNPVISSTLVRRTRRIDPVWNAEERDPVFRSGGTGASPIGRRLRGFKIEQSIEGYSPSSDRRHVRSRRQEKVPA
jgi:hypothetical protein